jgi:hypothetical protein
MYLRGQDYERLDYHILDEELIERWIKQSCRYNKIVPISFSTRGKLMFSKLMEYMSKRMIRIHPSMNKLIVSLRTATGAKQEMQLDKEKTDYDDCLDSLRLATYAVSSIVQG